ncbi:Superoxide dismutase [Lentibacillus sp. JNUCC-1]|uniref:superoxide dismutase family protein n=1 Tax=Lentibacillus sp. JNUCC-1 TaxID=2654513 RepID=UPI0012E8539C|nr:superoxide dismutase family protein [Lentibacillus sp. JNUCC-1]MUV37505.1 Superoxide dismutase [Lentibacillus sp. JNUCC-1]
MLNKNWLLGCVLTFFVITLAACNPSPDATPEQQETEDPGVETSKAAEAGPEQVETTLINSENETIGSAVLTEKPDGVHIKLEAKDLPPGKHGFHIHEKGVCEPPSFKSAGGHFNPTNKEHGFDNPEGPHAGDLLNIEVSKSGTVMTEALADKVTLKPDQPNSLLDGEGTALMIHAKADDYKSQPAGDAGDRIACGVIGAE